MEPFAQAMDVQRRLDFTLDELETSAVQLALEDLSNEARFIAGREWSDVGNVPNVLRTLVVKAVARWARNMDGYVQSRAADETLIWSDLKSEEVGAPHFTRSEVNLIRAVGSGRSGEPFFGTAEMYAHMPPARRVDLGYLAIEGMDPSTKPFPFNLPGERVW